MHEFWPNSIQPANHAHLSHRTDDEKINSPMVDLCFQMKSITIGSLVPYVLNVWLIPITYLARQRGVESGSHCTKSLWAHNWNLVKIIFLIMMS